MRLLHIFIILFFLNVNSQERKCIEAYRFLNPPTIDGKLSESEWSKIKPAENYVLWKPVTRFGKKIPTDYDTKAYFGYDDKAIYIGGKLSHPNPASIRREFGQRDQIFGVDTEGFWVSIDTNDDKESQFSFLVGCII